MKNTIQILSLLTMFTIASCGGDGGDGGQQREEDNGTTGGTAGGSNGGTAGGTSGGSPGGRAARLFYDSELTAREKIALDNGTEKLGQININGSVIPKFTKIFGGSRSSNVVNYV